MPGIPDTLGSRITATTWPSPAASASERPAVTSHPEGSCSLEVHVQACCTHSLMRLLRWCPGVQVTNSGSLVWYCETSGEEVWSSKQR